MVTFFFFIAVLGSVSVMTELPHIYCKPPRGEKKKKLVFRTLLAILKLFPMKQLLTSVLGSRILTEFWRKTRSLTHLWSTGHGIMLDTCLDFMSEQNSAEELLELSKAWGNASGSKEEQWVTVTFKSHHHKSNIYSNASAVMPDLWRFYFTMPFFTWNKEKS